MRAFAGGGRNLLINKIKCPRRAKAHKFFGVLKAFTLAEVLVTLTILGILASIIVPNVVHSYKVRQTISALKRGYSLVDNAIQNTFVYDGDYEKLGITECKQAPCSRASEDFARIFAQNMSVEKICPYETQSECYDIDSVKPLYESGESVSYKSLFQTIMLLKNGMVIGVTVNNSSPSTQLDDRLNKGQDGAYGHIFIDINGNKAPNKVGHDVFAFAANEKGLMLRLFALNPSSAVSSNAIGKFYHYRNCMKDSPADFPRSSGLSCGSWIMITGNMDYLKKDITEKYKVLY